MRIARVVISALFLSLCACGDNGALANREPPDAPSDTGGIDRSVPNPVDMGAPAPRPSAAAPARTQYHALEGVWLLVGTRAPGSDGISPPADDTQRLKYVSARRFASLTLKGDSIVRAIAGSCRLGIGEYEESIESVLRPDDRWMLRREFGFAWRLDGDRWVHEGTVQGPGGATSVHEVWQRVE